MIEFFIDVAQECFNIGNFNSLMAIVSECRARRAPSAVRTSARRRFRSLEPVLCFQLG